jgi:hypothetical protein
MDRLNKHSQLRKEKNKMGEVVAVKESPKTTTETDKTDNGDKQRTEKTKQQAKLAAKNLRALLAQPNATPEDLLKQVTTVSGTDLIQAKNPTHKDSRYQFVSLDVLKRPGPSETEGVKGIPSREYKSEALPRRRSQSYVEPTPSQRAQATTPDKASNRVVTENNGSPSAPVQEQPQNEKTDPPDSEYSKKFAQLEELLDAGKITSAEFNRGADALGDKIALSEDVTQRWEQVKKDSESGKISPQERNERMRSLAEEAGRERRDKIFGSSDTTEDTSRVPLGLAQEVKAVTSVEKNAVNMESPAPMNATAGNSAESAMEIPTDYKELIRFEKRNFDSFSQLPTETFKKIYTQQLGETYRTFLEHKIQAEIDRQNPGVQFPDTVASIVGNDPAFLQRAIFSETGRVVDLNELVTVPFSQLAKEFGIRLPDNYFQHFR